MGGELSGQEDGAGLGEFTGAAGEAGPGDGLAGGVLEAGRFQTGHLRPVTRGDVLQVFGVGGGPDEERPEAFDAAELLFGGGFLFARTGQAVLAEDAGDGVAADGQMETNEVEAFTAPNYTASNPLCPSLQLRILG